MKRKIISLLLVFIMIFSTLVDTTLGFSQNRNNSSTQEADTIINLKTLGLKGKEFNWDSVRGKIKIHFEYTDLNGTIIKIQNKEYVFTKDSPKNVEYYVGWPLEGVQSMQIVTEFDGDYNTKAISNKANSTGGSGKLTFNLKVYELPITNIEVKYKNIFENDLSQDFFKEDEVMPKFKVTVGENFELNLPKANNIFNLRNLEKGSPLEKIFTKDELALIADNMKTKELNSLEKLNITINDKKSGKLNIGSGDDLKEFDYNIDESKENIVINMLYYPIVNSGYDSEGKLPELKDGYIRLKFNTDGKYKDDWTNDNETESPKKGNFINGSKIYYIDIKKGTAFNDKKVIEELQNIRSPKLNVYNEEQKLEENIIFKEWSPNIDKTLIGVAKENLDFEVLYEGKYSNDKIIPYIPDNKDNPTDKNDKNIPKVGKDGKNIDINNYKIVSIKTEDRDKGTLLEGNNEKEIISLLIKNDLENIKFSDIKVGTKAKDNYKFWYFDKDNDGAKVLDSDEVIENTIYVAHFVENGQEIIKNHPDLPENVYEVKVLRDENSIKANELYGKSYAVFKNSKLAENKFPKPEAVNTSQNPLWYMNQDTDAIENPSNINIVANTTFIVKANKTNADKVRDLGGLEPESIKVWVGDEINWSKGIKAKTEANSDKIKELLANATIKDNTKPERSSKTKGDYSGVLLITFEDKSELEIENQMLYVRENKIIDKNDNNVPEDAIEVSFTKALGIKDLEEKSLRVKVNTKLEDSDFPKITLENEYKNPVWTPKDRVITNTNKDFIVSATSSSFDINKITKLVFTKDPDKMTYINGDKAKHDGLIITLTDENDNVQVVTKDKLSEYNIVITPSEITKLTKEDNGKYFVAKVNNKDGQEITANSPNALKVKDKIPETPKNTKDEVIPYLPIDEEPTKGSDGRLIPNNYYTVIFKSSDVTKGKVKIGSVSGFEVRAKVKSGTDLSKIAEAIANSGYEFVAWTPKLGLAIDGKEYIANFKKSVVVPIEKSKLPTVNKITEGDKEITGSGESGADITIELQDGTKITGKVDGKGNWKVVIPEDKKLKKDDTIKVTQQEKGKDKSLIVEKIVEGKEIIPNPTPNPKPKPSDSDKYQPKGKDIIVKQGDIINPEDTIDNLKELPEKTKVKFKKPIDIQKIGDNEVEVEIEYPDGSKDQIKVKITIKEKVMVEPQKPSSSNPNTGDSGVAIFIPFILIAGAILFIISKRKNKS